MSQANASYIESSESSNTLSYQHTTPNYNQIMGPPIPMGMPVPMGMHMPVPMGMHMPVPMGMHMPVPIPIPMGMHMPVPMSMPMGMPMPYSYPMSYQYPPTQWPNYGPYPPYSPYGYPPNSQMGPPNQLVNLATPSIQTEQSALKMSEPTETAGSQSRNIVYLSPDDESKKNTNSTKAISNVGVAVTSVLKLTSREQIELAKSDKPDLRINTNSTPTSVSNYQAKLDESERKKFKSPPQRQIPQYINIYREATNYGALDKYISLSEESRRKVLESGDANLIEQMNEGDKHFERKEWFRQAGAHRYIMENLPKNRFDDKKSHNCMRWTCHVIHYKACYPDGSELPRWPIYSLNDFIRLPKGVIRNIGKDIEINEISEYKNHIMNNSEYTSLAERLFGSTIDEDNTRDILDASETKANNLNVQKTENTQSISQTEQGIRIYNWKTLLINKEISKKINEETEKIFEFDVKSIDERINDFVLELENVRKLKDNKKNQWKINDLTKRINELRAKREIANKMGITHEITREVFQELTENTVDLDALEDEFNPKDREAESDNCWDSSYNKNSEPVTNQSSPTTNSIPVSGSNAGKILLNQLNQLVKTKQSYENATNLPPNHIHSNTANLVAQLGTVKKIPLSALFSTGKQSTNDNTGSNINSNELTKLDNELEQIIKSKSSNSSSLVYSANSRRPEHSSLYESFPSPNAIKK